MTNEKPKHLLVLKIVGIVGIMVAIAGIVLVVTGFGDFESNNFMIGGFMATFGFGAGFAGIMIGFGPEFKKMSVKTQKWTQEQNKEDLADIVTTQADINKQAITTTAKAVKDGLSNDKFCKHCGAQIDADSKFCKDCGKEQ